jgi:two-component system, chemotaxis family, sensor kinase CheA
MSEMGGKTDLLSEWQLQVNELATNLLLNGPDQSVIAGLKELSHAAIKAGFPHVAQAATKVVESLPTDSSGASAVDEALRKGLAVIQQLLSEPGTAGAPSEPAADAAFNLSLNPLAQDAELVGDFITESREHLGAIEKHMLTLEKNPDEKEAVHAVFRGFHTIKGLAGFLEFMPIRDVAHDVETLLDLARNAKLVIGGSVVDVVLESVDYLKHAIEVVEGTLSGDSTGVMGDNRQLLVRLQGFINGSSEPSAQSNRLPRWFNSRPPWSR